MAYYLSPLVDIKEIDLSTTIPAVATSIGVELLRNTYKGPEQKREFVSSEDELIRVFGKPTNNLYCYEDLLSAAGFLKYGNKLYVTRVMPIDSTFSGTKAASGGFGTYTPALTLSDLGNQNDPYSGNPDEFADDIVVDDNFDMWMIAMSRGAWGDSIRISMVNRSTYNRLNTTPASGIYNEAWYPYSDSQGTVKPSWVGLVDQACYFTVMSADAPLETDKDFLVIVELMEQGETSWSIAEVWNVSTNPLALDGQGRTRYAPTLINQESRLIRVNLNDLIVDQPWKTSNMTYEYFTQGSDGTVTGNELIAEQLEALKLYESGEDIDINILIDGDKPLDVKRKMIEVCEKRKDCMSIMDCQYNHVVNNRGNEVEDLTEWRKGIGAYVTNNLNENTSYASLYGNWIEVYDKYNKKYRWIPAAGHVAGIYAHTDDVSDPWWAPAGLNRAIINGVRRLAWNPKLGDRDMLYKDGINPIVSFAGQGKVVWGQKTMLDKSSAFNRVNVRRLFIVLEKAISTAAKYFLFEPNDEITRSQLKSMIEPFLRDVKARRGVYDYRVICDETNNTPERIDRNELWATILIKPTRVAEFIVLQFVALKTGASFEESAAQVDNFSS